MGKDGGKDTSVLKRFIGQQLVAVSDQRLPYFTTASCDNVTLGKGETPHKPAGRTVII